MSPYRIVLSGGRSNAVKKFKSNQLSKTAYLLVDLDASPNDKNQVLSDLTLNKHKD